MKKTTFSDEFISEISNEKFKNWETFLLSAFKEGIKINDNLTVLITKPNMNMDSVYNYVSNAFPKINFNDNTYCLNRFFSSLCDIHDNRWAPKRDRDLINSFFEISNRIRTSAKQQFSSRIKELEAPIKEIDSLIDSCPKNKIEPVVQMVEKLFKALPKGTIIDFDTLKLYNDTKTFYEVYLLEKKKF